MQAMKLEMSRIPPCRNAIGIKHAATAVSVVC